MPFPLTKNTSPAPVERRKFPENFRLHFRPVWSTILLFIRPVGFSAPVFGGETGKLAILVQLFIIAHERFIVKPSNRAAFREKGLFLTLFEVFYEHFTSHPLPRPVWRAGGADFTADLHMNQITSLQFRNCRISIHFHRDLICCSAWI